MAIQVRNGELLLAKWCLVDRLGDDCALTAHPGMKGLQVIDEHGEHLRPGANIPRTGASGTCPAQHHDSSLHPHLGALRGPSYGASQDQAFGDGTTNMLRRLRIGVGGASGTGSPTIEQLKRLGVGEIVAIDDDYIEDRNLNRITFATAKHA